ncbi:hypothetical protein [Bradyrhizobium sp. USDA 4353]
MTDKSDASAAGADDTPSRLDTDLEFDPLLEEGRASKLRVALYAVACLLTVAVVLWGIHSN